MELDGKHCAGLKKVDGLAYEADIGTMDHGPINMQTKHMTNFKYTPAKITMGFAQAGVLWEWIRASFRRDYATKSGAFIAGDFNYKATHRIDFMNALITEVTLPKLDGSSKEPAFVEVSFEAEDARHTKAGGEDIKGDYGVKQKAFLPSCFRFDLAGLTDACKRVATIDAITWKQSVVADQIGAPRILNKHPCKVTVGDCKLSISSADHEPWRQWAEAWFINGKSLQEHHKDGSITFLAPDMSTEIGTLQLKGCGLKKFSDEPFEANSEKVKRFNVELYIEELDFIPANMDA